MGMDFFGAMAAGAQKPSAINPTGGQSGTAGLPQQQQQAMQQNKDPLDPQNGTWHPVSYAGGQAGTPWGNIWNSWHGNQPQYYQNNSGDKINAQDYGNPELMDMMQNQAQQRATQYGGGGY